MRLFVTYIIINSLFVIPSLAFANYHPTLKLDLDYVKTLFVSPVVPVVSVRPIADSFLYYGYDSTNYQSDFDVATLNPLTNPQQVIIAKIPLEVLDLCSGSPVLSVSSQPATKQIDYSLLGGLDDSSSIKQLLNPNYIWWYDTTDIKYTDHHDTVHSFARTAIETYYAVKDNAHSIGGVPCTSYDPSLYACYDHHNIMYNGTDSGVFVTLDSVLPPSNYGICDVNGLPTAPGVYCALTDVSCTAAATYLSFSSSSCNYCYSYNSVSSWSSDGSVSMTNILCDTTHQSDLISAVPKPANPNPPTPDRTKTELAQLAIQSPYSTVFPPFHSSWAFPGSFNASPLQPYSSASAIVKSRFSGRVVSFFNDVKKQFTYTFDEDDSSVVTIDDFTFDLSVFSSFFPYIKTCIIFVSTIAGYVIVTKSLRASNK